MTTFSSRNFIKFDSSYSFEYGRLLVSTTKERLVERTTACAVSRCVCEEAYECARVSSSTTESCLKGFEMSSSRIADSSWLF